MALEHQCKKGRSRAGFDGGGIWIVVIVVQGTKDEIEVKALDVHQNLYKWVQWNFAPRYFTGPAQFFP